MTNQTALGITITMIIYFCALFLFFGASPPEIIYGHSLNGISLNPVISGNGTATSDAVSAVEIFTDFAGFDIEGIPWWMTLVGVYVPGVILSLGIYGLVRGI